MSSVSADDTTSPVNVSSAVRLPWGAMRERVAFPECIQISTSAKPGAFALQMLFAEFTVLAEKKIEQVLELQVRDIRTHTPRSDGNRT